MFYSPINNPLAQQAMLYQYCQCPLKDDSIFYLMDWYWKSTLLLWLYRETICHVSFVMLLGTFGKRQTIVETPNTKQLTLKMNNSRCTCVVLPKLDPYFRQSVSIHFLQLFGLIVQRLTIRIEWIDFVEYRIYCDDLYAVDLPSWPFLRSGGREIIFFVLLCSDH